uniref:OO_Ba0013J05-OO_Ba0033A15.24 protein n=1 Tax=Oryza officinalis TaxID=4535 RepID=D0ABG7_9ORYZ|nr:OO_Ba0013J05-OO_Ba0033A15.24 [Oryza officinalis]
MKVLDRRHRKRNRPYYEDRRRSPDNYDDGVTVFTRDLRQVDWPSGFKPTGIDKYDGKTDPESWLTVYTLAIHAAGGDSKAMANYLPIALADSARNWLTSLPREGVRDELLIGKFERKPPRMVKKMFETANSYAKSDDAITASRQDKHDKIQIQICIIGIHGYKLISYASGMDQSEYHRRPAFTVADWCLLLHGWLVTPPLLGVYVFIVGLPSPPPTGVSAYTVGWSHHRC